MAQGAVVYEIKNNITGQVYIGVTVDFERRKAEHFSLEYWAKHTSKLLYKNMAKYGSCNFSMSKIAEFSSEEDAYVFEVSKLAHLTNVEDADVSNRVLNVGKGGERPRGAKKVFVFDLTLGCDPHDDTIKEYTSQNEAARAIGAKQGAVHPALNREDKRYGNYLIAKSKEEIIDAYYLFDGVLCTPEHNRKSKVTRLPKILSEIPAETNSISNKYLYEAVGITDRKWSELKNKPYVVNMLREYGWYFATKQRLERLSV